MLVEWNTGKAAASTALLCKEMDGVVETFLVEVSWAVLLCDEGVIDGFEGEEKVV